MKIDELSKAREKKNKKTNNKLQPRSMLHKSYHSILTLFFLYRWARMTDTNLLHVLFLSPSSLLEVMCHLCKIYNFKPNAIILNKTLCFAQTTKKKHVVIADCVLSLCFCFIFRSQISASETIENPHEVIIQ